MELVYDSSLMIGLEYLTFKSLFFCAVNYIAVESVNARIAVYSGLTLAEEIEIWSMYNKYFPDHIYSFLSLTNFLGKKGFSRTLLNLMNLFDFGSSSIGSTYNILTPAKLAPHTSVKS